MPNVYYSGVDGRVRAGTGGGGTAVAGVSKWALQLNAPPIVATNFESTTDSNNNTWRELVLPSGGGTGPKVGIITPSCAIEGRFNSDATAGTLALLNIGAQITLDLMLSKTQPFGFFNLSGVVTEFALTSDINSTEASGFTMKVELTGVLPGGTTVSA